MHKMRLWESIDGAKLQMGYVETDPSGRYGRFKEVLGKGAMKTVYKAFDEELGTEVAWNQVKVKDVLRSPEELQRLYSEVHLLKSLNHESIIKLYAHWINVYSRTFNFITEMLTSGTLREYRKTYKRVSIRAVKNWARQILHGLAYLHSLDPPVIHRDLKCDNIFVNGHLGQVKIGDLGFAAILSRTHHAHSVIGTPEFMAPELYEEEYDELVDVYSFGMCMLEMLTSEYPYSECSNPAQIYKKVTSGKLPEAIHRIEDVEARNFVKKCLQNVAKRPSAQELLADHFLDADAEVAPPVLSIKSRPTSTSELTDLLMLMESKSRKTNMTITGTMDPTDDTIFLKVKITDEHGEARNVYFPFDILSDTAADVANEMVKELEITDWEPLEIAEMINDAISAIVPLWNHGKSMENQYSFDYNDGNDDDDDDYGDRIHHPFYSYSAHSSCQGSLTNPEFHSPSSQRGSCGWFPENFLFNNDDTSSQGSISSHNYSNLHFCSGIGNESNLTPPTADRSNFIANNQTPTRFGPQQRKVETCHSPTDPLSCANRRRNGPNGRGKISRVKSLLDIRSQQLHRSLVEEVNKRRLFKTVGAIENIGFKEFRTEVRE